MVYSIGKPILLKYCKSVLSQRYIILKFKEIDN